MLGLACSHSSSVDLNKVKPMFQMHIHHFIFAYTERKLATKALLDYYNCCILLLLDTASVINSIFNYSRAEQMPAVALGGQWVSAWPTDLQMSRLKFEDQLLWLFSKYQPINAFRKSPSTQAPDEQNNLKMPDVLVVIRLRISHTYTRRKYW